MEIQHENKLITVFTIFVHSLRMPVLALVSYAGVKMGANFIIIMSGETFLFILKCATLIVAPLRLAIDLYEKYAGKPLIKKKNKKK